MRIAVHICCGPCAVYPVEQWFKQNHIITGFWYNPNIHPFVEYIRRLKSLKRFSALMDLKIIYDDSYDLDNFLLETASTPTEPERCYKCYTMRLARTAEFAREEGFDFFTTTLTVSPYQKHDIIKDIGRKMAEKNNIEFLYHDFRDGYRQGRSEARELGLYLQRYCGCIYSERDRFIDMKPEKIIEKYAR